MVLIEFKKIIKDSMVLVLLLLMLVIGLLFTDKDLYIAPALEIFLIFYASFAGWSMFERERQERAGEYLLSLPSSRLRLFLAKFFPRLAVAGLMLVVYELAYQQFSMHFLWPDYRFIYLYLTVFLLSVSLSLSMKSFLSTFFITLFLSVGLYFFIHYLDFSKMDANIAIQAGLSFLAFPILFILFFQRYDIRPISHFNKKYIPALIVFLLLLSGVTYITSNVKWWHCYLTENGSLVRMSRNITFIENKKGQGRTIGFSLSPLHEKNNRVLASLFSSTESPEQLVRLDLDSGEIRKRYSIPKGYWFHDFIDTRTVIGNRVFFLLTRLGHKNYQIMEVAGDQTRFIPIKKDFGDEIFHMISGASEDPLQFFILTFDRKKPVIGKNIYRVFEDGRVEKLFSAIAMSTWENRILRFTGMEMILYETGQGVKEIDRKKGDFKKVRRKFENFIQKKVLLKTNGDFYAFDLKNLTLEKVNVKKMPYFYNLNDRDELRLVWTDGPEISVSVWKESHMQVEKVWYTGITGLKIIRVFPSGVVVYNQKEHQVFLFHKNGGGDNSQKNNSL